MPIGSTLPDFIVRWRGATLSERSAAQSHFIELCQILGEPTPAIADPQGSFYTFEKGVDKVGGGDGFADVWKRGFFAWEYKGKHKSLTAAYLQLLDYREDLENPPLLVVCDLDRFEVHTNFTNTVKKVYAFNLSDLASASPVLGTALSALEVLRAVFTNPSRLRADQARVEVTEQAAAEFARLAEGLRRSGVTAESAAHFLMRLLFCLFAEDIGLLPSGLIAKIAETTRLRSHEFRAVVAPLFQSMALGGYFGADAIRRFNGGLFTDDAALNLSSADLEVLGRAARLDWASVEPGVFGTLFERSLDPDKRSQLGAHYTSRDDILRIVEPVLMEPLRREWIDVQSLAADLIAKRAAATPSGRTRHQQALQHLLTGFAGRIATVRVLDPACGSGNFLYVALKELLDLEKEVMTFAAQNGMSAFFPQVSPSQLLGIEVNPYAHELASVVVWIGYIQWLHDNGFGMQTSPILQTLHNIERKDAILDHDEAGTPVEPPWPAADVIIGNPPFLGGKLLRAGLGDAYVDQLFRVYDGRVPREADLVCYWFERARELVATGKVGRVGLLATQGIRGGANRRVLERIKETGDIFMAWSDRPWVLDGAAVHVSFVGFDAGKQKTRVLDGKPVETINVDLSSGLDLTKAQRLRENLNLAFMGDTKGGAFDIAAGIALPMIHAPLNPNNRPNLDVIRPWVNGLDVTRRPRGMWIVDFGVDRAEEDAALYEQPYQYVRRQVRPERQTNNRAAYRERWWIHMEPRPAMRAALAPLRRYVVTPTVAKYRLFTWLESPTLPDHQLIIVCKADDYCFGVLHSMPHELWARGLGTQLREVESGFRYTPTTTFETFPFPWPPGQELSDDPRVKAIANAARELVNFRDRWLNPEGASESELKTRTLTNLYNARPTWLDNAHRQLDGAVFAAYGWPHDLDNDQVLERLLALNRERSKAAIDPAEIFGEAEPAAHP